MYELNNKIIQLPINYSFQVGNDRIEINNPTVNIQSAIVKVSDLYAKISGSITGISAYIPSLNITINDNNQVLVKDFEIKIIPANKLAVYSVIIQLPDGKEFKLSGARISLDQAVKLFDEIMDRLKDSLPLYLNLALDLFQRSDVQELLKSDKFREFANKVASYLAQNPLISKYVLNANDILQEQGILALAKVLLSNRSTIENQIRNLAGKSYKVGNMGYEHHGHHGYHMNNMNCIDLPNGKLCFIPDK